MAEHKLGNATRTVLAFGAVEAPVALYKTVKSGKTKAETWDTAGPNGGKLHLKSKAVEVEEREDEPLDPFAAEASPETPAEPFVGREAAGLFTGQDAACTCGHEESDGRSDVLNCAVHGIAARRAPDEPTAADLAAAEEEAQANAGGEREPTYTVKEYGSTFISDQHGSRVIPPGEKDPLTAAEDEGRPLFGEYHQVLVEEGSGVEVEREDVRRGLRRGDKFVDLTDQLARIDADSKLDVARIHSFIRVERVPRAAIKGSYYIAPDDKRAPRVLQLLLEGMKRTGRVALVKWTKRTEQALGVITPYGRENALVILELEWEANWIDPTPRVLSHHSAHVTPAEVDRAVMLIEALSDSVESLRELENDAVAARRHLREYVERNGEAPEELVDAEVIDDAADSFEALLAASLGQTRDQ